jgi:dihydroorotase (multifunctional complex type)
MERKMLLINNGKVWRNGALQEINIFVEDGKIKDLQAAGKKVMDSTPTINACNCYVFPGGVDIHAHIQDGAETFFRGSSSAVKGGITTVLDMPPFKTVTNRKQCEQRIQWGEDECVSDFGLTGGIIIDLNDLENLNEICDCGVRQFKVFMLSNPPMEVLWRSVQFAAKSGLRLVVHMEEPALLKEVDWNDPLGFTKANPPEAENAAAAHMLEMARAAGAPIHVCHVSSARTVELIDQYKGWGTDVTAETAPHYLILNEDAFFTQADRVVVTPALRKERDNMVLWQALEDGVIDAIISDHFLGALPDPTKERPSAKNAEPGIAGLEMTIPLLFDQGVAAGKISLNRFMETLSTTPAKLAGISNRKGEIEKGMDADLVVFNPEKIWEVHDLGEGSRISTLPYEGWQIKGKVEKTLVRGKVVWDGKEIVCEPGWGKYVPASDLI